MTLDQVIRRLEKLANSPPVARRLTDIELARRLTAHIAAYGLREDLDSVNDVLNDWTAGDGPFKRIGEILQNAVSRKAAAEKAGAKGNKNEFGNIL